MQDQVNHAPALPSKWVGQRVGRLVVIARLAPRNDNARFLVRCDCGVEKEVWGPGLSRGTTTSCGCYQREATGERSLKHGHTAGQRPTRTWQSWRAMKARCADPGNIGYRDYGGRGIKVCARWVSSFDRFLADMGERPDGHTLDRIDVNGDYEPSNCRWATPAQQTENRR